VTGEGSDFEGLTGGPPSSVEGTPKRRSPAERPRLVAAGILGAVVAVFALLNLGDVKVHWLFATGSTPLIVVIAFAFILGMLVDRLIIRAKRKRTA
jgi:uncharacterized integral membrane protein